MPNRSDSPGWPLKLVVARRTMVAADVVELELCASDGAALPAWEPGSHLEVSAGDHGVRQYSLCGSTADRATYTIAVLRESAGRGGSQWIHESVHEGDVLAAEALRNHFRLTDAAAYRFVAGGIGITPLIPMIESLERAGKPWSLLYGGRSRATMAFAIALEERYGDRVQVRPEDECGLLDLETSLADISVGTQVYACGPGALLDAVERRCAVLPGIGLHVERFQADRTAHSLPEDTFEVEVASTGDVVEVGSKVSILEALEHTGLTLRSSCLEGTCGTCEVGVVSGDIDHRDYVLDDDEKARGDVMMICVSRCRSGRLVLDL